MNNDTNSLQQTSPRQSWHQLADEGAAMETLERDNRIRDLEAERGTYRMLAAAGLESTARLTARNKQLAARIDHVNAELRDLLNAPCLTCKRRAQRHTRPVAIPFTPATVERSHDRLGC